MQVRDLPLVFAVDVSGSTRGRILDEEKRSISLLMGGLKPAESNTLSRVIPWDGRCLGVIHPQQTPFLTPGAGTDPSVVLEDAVARRALQEASLWFLMTDGFIEKPLINKFANAISKTGIHGTASVIILYGYRVQSPYDCNVSVGLSVFAVAPHCIFLFHDVRSGDLYVLQAKGSFTTLLPEHARFTPFGPTTRWQDLIRITYEDLSRVQVPRPTRLSADAVVLPGGKTLDMTSLYNDTLSKEETIELLADYSALDVILLAAKTRGKDQDVKFWIESARRHHRIPEAALMTREDVGSNGLNCMKILLEEVKSLAPIYRIEDLWGLLSRDETPDGIEAKMSEATTITYIDSFRSGLRVAHRQNWSHFESQVEADWELSCKLNDTLAEVLSTMTMNDARAPASPAMLTPMSSPVGGGRRPYTAHYSGGSSARNEARMSPLSPGPKRNYYHHQDTGPATYQQAALSPYIGHRSRRTKDLLFLPGYKGERSTVYDRQPGAYATCPICREPRSIQTLLLQTSSDEPETLHLPKANQRSGHMYPLVLGNYPETDVILPITCCDGCASLLLQAGELPNDDRVTIALPLVPLHKRENRQLWEEKLGEVYGHRFRDSIVFLVFLSTLCTTIEDLVDGAIQSECQTLMPSLEWCCRELSKLPGISTMAGLTPVGSPLSGVVNDTMPLQQALRVTFQGFQSTIHQSPLLEYPIDGFLVLVRLAGLMEDVGPEDVERFVWMRLLHYLAEQHVQLQRKGGPGEASKALQNLVNKQTETSNERGAGTEAVTDRCYAVPLSALDGTYLIPSDSDILEQFLRTGSSYSIIADTDKYHAALAVFLHLMATLTEGSQQIWDDGDLFVKLQYRADKLCRTEDGLRDIFFEGKLVDDEGAVKLITAAYEVVVA
ncbi:conserved hypothetical protein [Verticillium alfalfae VaMs.102]|uniref:Uncharacterized protein n=1 Tax=Verticillium alfalfae (strain VaMs.102 / ATCC MYA-4576 / FGSC 10136) TaxID=526221 RepID=C9SMB8_VERA1|nr:conserved hypothetical protein [Verticillium alfalfae VaMs.102]EEY19933.1 conserved hypothetical protein [Verticillium alfalfae VaMs.102]